MDFHPWFDSARHPEFGDCEACQIHFVAMNEVYGPYVTAMSFIMVAVKKDLSPSGAVFEYFAAFHAEGHPTDPDGPEVPEPLFSGVVDVVRRRVEPHPFVTNQIVGATSQYCAYGALEGTAQFCGRGTRDTIHSHRCPRCMFRGWIWTSNGKPYCGHCKVTYDEAEE